MASAAPYDHRGAEVAGGAELADSQSGSGGAQVQASLGATAGMTNYITYFVVSANEVAAVVHGTITVAGVIGGPLTYQFVETTSAGGYLAHAFRPPLPATAVNTAITVTLAAISSGSDASVVVTGWQT